MRVGGVVVVNSYGVECGGELRMGGVVGLVVCKEDGRG